MKVQLSAAMLRLLVVELAIFPCFFGSALRGAGITDCSTGLLPSLRKGRGRTGLYCA